MRDMMTKPPELAGIVNGRGLCSTAIAAVLALSATPAYAQEGDEIIVTARKKEERLSDVPAALSIASGEQLKQLGIREASDLEALTPGFVFRPSPQGSPTFQIRGIGFFEEAIGISPTVTTYIDQAPLPFSVMAQGAMFDVERVEVLKGPQGTLFGQNSTGGAINFVVAKPTDEMTAGFDAEYGRFQSYQLGGFLSGPLSSTLKVRLSAQVEGQDGWQRTYAVLNSQTGRFEPTSKGDGRRLGSRDFKIGRLVAEWEPSASARFELNLTGWKDKSETQAQQFVAATPDTPGNTGSVPFWPQFGTFPPAPNSNRQADWDPQRSFKRDDDLVFASLSGEIHLGDDIQLNTISSYSRIRLSRPVDLDGTPFTSVFIVNGGRLESFSQEVRLSGKVGDASWMLGGNYQEDDTSEQQDIVLNLTNSLPFFDHAIQDMTGKAKTSAVFGSAEYALSPRVNAQLSARYTNSTRRMAGCTRDGGNGMFGGFISLVFGLPPIAPGGCGTIDTTTFTTGLINKRFSEDNVSWKATLDWKPADGTLLYGSVSRGYKAGNFVSITAVFSDSFDPVPQEKLTAYEVGLKSKLFDGRLNVGLSGFYYDYRNKQLSGFRDGGVFGVINSVVSIPKSRVYGAEFQASFKLAESVTLEHASSYLSTKVDGDFLAVDPAGGAQQRRGESFPGTPKFQMVNRIMVDVPLASGNRIFGNLSVTTRSNSRTNFGFDPLFKVSGYSLVDGTIGFGFGNSEISVFASNLFDKFYYATVQATGDNVTRISGFPRTFGVRLSIR